MPLSMEDIVDVYKERDGIGRNKRKEQLELKTELRELAKDAPIVHQYLTFYEMGTIDWHEMLLRLSIHLVKQNRKLYDTLVKMNLEGPPKPIVLSGELLCVQLEKNKGESI